MRRLLSRTTGAGADRSGIRGFVLTSCVLLGAMVVTSLGQAVPGSVLPAGQRATLRLIWPQGWSFFAATDTREYLVAYTEPNDGSGPKPVAQRQSSVDAGWGLRRDSVLATYELSVLAEAVPTSLWRSCSGLPLSGCAAAARAPRRVLPAPFPNPPICGPATIVFAHPRPWRHRVDEEPGVDRFARVDVRC